MIDKTISHYRVIEKLGEGAMGEVYLAEDPRLQRRVALKFLAAHLKSDSDFKDRFIVEARAASALNHPNVCAIYDIGESEEGRLFITMPAYEGMPLDSLLEEEGSLPISKAIDIIQQIAAGLGQAHGKDIIHRDIKPANVFVTYDGRAIVLDFGLAKLTGDDDDGRPPESEGTAAYRAPEQVRAEPVDTRTDIWAVGMVFYEMIAGRRPFNGAYESAVSYQIMNESPDPLDLGDDAVGRTVWSVIEKCLAKKPEDRFANTAEFLDALRPVTTSSLPESGADVDSEDEEPISIVVLPFRDMSPEKDQAYFCDGITEELIDGLSRVDGWRIVSRTSSFAMRDSGLDATEVGERVNASHIVDGSLRKSGNRIRVSVQMVSTTDGFEVWSEKYNRELEDVFDIQDEIAHAIVEKLKDTLGDFKDERIVPKRTANVEAHNLYLMGRYELSQRTQLSVSESIALFSEALTIDPDFAQAHAGLADAHILKSFQGILEPRLAMPKAIVAAERAIALDDTLEEAYISRGCAAAVYEWDWKSAEKHFQRAIELSPNSATAHHWLATWVLMPLGRLEQAFIELYHAESLDPLSMSVQAGIGWQHYFDRRYEAAEIQLRRTLESFPDSVMAMDILGQSLLQLERHEEALDILQKAVELSSRRTLSLGSLGHALATAGRRAKAEQILNELNERRKSRYVSLFDMALIHAGLDDVDSALLTLKQAVAEKNGWLCFVAVEPRFDALRSDPRYHAILEQTGLGVHKKPPPSSAPNVSVPAATPA